MGRDCGEVVAFGDTGQWKSKDRWSRGVIGLFYLHACTHT